MNELLYSEKLLKSMEAVNKVYTSAAVGKLLQDVNYKSMLDSILKINNSELCKLQQTAREAMFNQSSALSLLSENISTVWDSIKINVPSIEHALKLNIPYLTTGLQAVYMPDDELSEEEQKKDAEASEKVLNEIFVPDAEKRIVTESPIIVVSPINDEVLRYLRDNPEEWYKLTSGQFEMAIQELYTRLGYRVERTKATRDGGKDLIIRKPDVLGDFIYYVECKKYAPNRRIGVGIVRDFKCTIDTDKVNAGIIATTSYFTKDARDFILDNKFDCQIKMHDFNTIKNFLDQMNL